MEFVFLQTAEKDAPSPFQLIEFSLRELFGAGVALFSLHLFRRCSTSMPTFTASTGAGGLYASIVFHRGAGAVSACTEEGLTHGHDQLMLIGIIPTTLIVLGGLLVMKAGKQETAERRFLLYLVAVSIVLLLIVVVAGLFSTDTNQTPGIISIQYHIYCDIGRTGADLAAFTGTERAAATPVAGVPWFRLCC